MTKLQRIDAFVLDKFQVAATYYERHTGRSLFDLARLGSLIYAAGCITHAANASELKAWRLLLAGVAVLLSAFMFWETAYIERLTHEGRFANVARVSPAERANRLIQASIAVSVCITASLFGYITPLDVGLVGIWAAVNFKACNTLPPSERHVEAPANAAEARS